MLLTHKALKEKSAELEAAVADARSARNLKTRQRQDAGDEREAARYRRRRKRKNDRELEQLLRRRVRVQVPLDERPRISTTTARKLYHRTVDTLRGATGISDARGHDGLYSLHFGFAARGFASTTGRRWRVGEAERAARYAVREDALEGGELGWWSNIADDRAELVAFFRAAEAFERHDRSNANVYVTEIIALPAELSARQRRRAVQRICRFFQKRGLPYVAAIHVPDSAGDQRNFHCHIIYSLRPAERHGGYDWSFRLAKENDINTRDGIAARRRQVVRDINATLHAAGIDKRYTHLSNQARRMAAPQAKVGQSRTWAERRLAALEARAERLREIVGVARRVQQSLDGCRTTVEKTRDAIEARLGEMRRAARASVRMGGAQSTAARAIVIETLEPRRAIIPSTATKVALDVDHSSTGIAAALKGHLRRIEQAGRSAAARLTLSTDAIRGRIEEHRDRVGAASGDRLPLVFGRLAALRQALQARRASVAAALIDARSGLDRAAKRIDLFEKRRTFDAIAAKVRDDWGTLISARTRLVQQMTVTRAEIRLWRPHTDPFPSSLATLRKILVNDLTDRKAQVVASTIAAERALAEAKIAGRKLIASGIGKGPGVVQRPRPAVDAAPTAAAPRPQLGAEASRPTSTGTVPPSRQTGTPAPALQRQAEHEREPIRRVADRPPAAAASTPAAEIKMSRSEGVSAKSLTELLREEARLRAAEARRKLRKAALARLSRHDIRIVTDSLGRHAVVKSGLPDGQMRALMDPAFDQETQVALGRIATVQAQQAASNAAIAKSQPRVPPQGNSAVPQAPSAADEDFEWLQRQEAHKQASRDTPGR